MSTVANVKSEEGAHFYFLDGSPCYEVQKKDGGMRPATLADARKLNLLPGVSSILKVLHKEALVVWRIEQFCLALLTTPRFPGEGDDAFTKRVLSTERVQDQESQIARDRGSEMHDGLEMLCKNQPVSPDLLPWIQPAFAAVMKYGSPIATESHCVGRGYGGRIDLIQKAPDCLWIWDWKTTKRLPEKGAYPEHRLQCSGYAMAHEEFCVRKFSQSATIKTGNVYISTVEQGKFIICEHEDWRDTFNRGFAPLVAFWQWQTGYIPNQD